MSHLLVDGANILHAWEELRRVALRDVPSARSQLVQQLTCIHDSEQVRLTIVFDGRGKELVVDHPSEHSTLSVIHTPSSLTADDVIEQMVANSAAPASCCVATDDRAERETVLAAGAMTIDANGLRDWVKRVQSVQRNAVQNLRAANHQQWKAKAP